MGDISPQSTHFCFLTTWLYEGSKARVVNGFNIWQHFSFNDSAKLTNYPTKLEQSWPNFSFIKCQQVMLGKTLLSDWVSAKAICSDFEHKVWSRFWSWSSCEILKLKFGQYFAADVWLRLRSWILVKVMKLGLVKILSLSLVEMLMFGWDFKVNAKSRFRNWS